MDYRKLWTIENLNYRKLWSTSSCQVSRNRQNLAVIFEIIIHLAKLGAPFEAIVNMKNLRIEDIF